MLALQKGFLYSVDYLDSPHERGIIKFHKPGVYPGTTDQELLRILIDRVKGRVASNPAEDTDLSWYNYPALLDKLRWCLREIEHLAAEEVGMQNEYSEEDIEKIKPESNGYLKRIPKDKEEDSQ